MKLEIIEATMTEPPANEQINLRRSRLRLERLSERLQEIVPAPEDNLFHIQRFIEDLKIINKRGELVPLIMNRAQETVFHRLMECREKRVPARFICCKSRQLGISTLIEAFIFALITHYPNRFALVAANSIESAQTIFAMAQRFRRYLEPGRTARPVTANARRIEYLAPHHSRLQIDTAANRSLGRGGTLHYVHASEVAFWERAEDPILAINQSVPQHWDTLVFWESTANGMHNLFHRTWIAAERGESDMEPIFLSWKGFPEYSLPVGQRERLQLSQDEEAYARKHDLSRDQIKWACYTRKNQCHDSWEKFHQEYPVAAQLAFTFTGMPWFSQDVIHESLERLARPPLKRGYLEFSAGDSSVPLFVTDPTGPLEVWLLPEPAHTYSLGMDVGEGVGADYTVIQVICNETGDVAARYRSHRVRAETAGVDSYLLGAYYNFGLLGIERNGPGLAALAACERGLSDYPQMTGYPSLTITRIQTARSPKRPGGWAGSLIKPPRRLC